MLINAATNQSDGIAFTFVVSYKYPHWHTQLCQNAYKLCPQLLPVQCFHSVILFPGCVQFFTSIPPSLEPFFRQYRLHCSFPSTKASACPQRRGPTPQASPRVSIRAKPQTTQHKKTLHILSLFFNKKWPDSEPISLPPSRSCSPSLPLCEVLTVQSGITVEETASDFIVSTHYGPLT